MIVIDNDFNKKEQSTNYETIYNKIIEYLKNRIDNNEILSSIIEESSGIIIQETDGEKYSIKLPNGSIRKNNLSRSSGAIRTNMVIELNGNELSILPGIALRPNYTNHQLIHELIHAMSSNQHNYFNNNIVYTKIGTKINYYDQKLDDYYMENNPSSDGLNEGITELITSEITNEYNGIYAPFVIASKLLMTDNNLLLNAYFSKDLTDLKKFYEDLEEKQSIITRVDLCNLSSKEMDVKALAKVVAGAMEYNKSYYGELNKEEYVNMIRYLDESYMLDNGSWSDLIESFENQKVR